MVCSFPNASTKSAVVTDDVAIYFAENYTISKRSFATGQVLWTHSLSATPKGQPVSVTVGGSTLVALLDDTQELLGIDADTGVVVWTTKVTKKLGYPPNLIGVSQSQLVTLQWTSGGAANPPGVEVYNATTGHKVWEFLVDAKAIGVSAGNLMNSYASFTVSNRMIHTSAIANLLLSDGQIIVDFLLDAESGDTLFFTNGTMLWSNLAINNQYAASISSPIGIRPIDYFGIQQYVNIYDAETKQIKTIAFDVNPASKLDANNMSLLVVQDTLLVAYFQWNLTTPFWLAAFDMDTGALKWNVTIPHMLYNTYFQNTEKLWNSTCVPLVLGNGQHMHFAAYNMRTGARAWYITPPVLNDVPFMFTGRSAASPPTQQTMTKINETRLEDIIVPNVMGWNRWSVDEQRNTLLEYDNLAMLSGVQAVHSAPGSTTDYIVISNKKLSRFAP